MKIVAFILCSALGAAGVAEACTCSAGTIEQVVTSAAAVFEGDVVTTELGPDGERTTSLLVRAAYKGVREGATVVVRSRDPNGKSCDLVGITPGRWLLIVNPQPDGTLWIGRCDGYSQRLGAAPSETVLRVRKRFHAPRAAKR